MDVDEERARLERAWLPRGVLRWLKNVDHKVIGKRYVVTAFVYFALAGAAALLMRLQLVRAENRFIGPDLYNQLFTVHGTTMMFLFAVPVMGGLAIYLVPLMVGTRNIAFPRLNAFGYFVFAFAASSSGAASSSAWAPTPAGSATCRCRAPSHRASGSTSGRTSSR
jgi:cytochrome c oxidase subunit 1